MSYKKERDWAKTTVEILKEAKLVVEVRREDLCCVNPLTVALNEKGKRRLCLDLSRCKIKIEKALKFKIELTLEALQVVEKEEYMYIGR